MLTPLLVAAMLATTTAADTAQVAPRPLQQRLELELDPAAPGWSGSLLTTLEVRAATRRLRLRFDASRVSRVELSDVQGRVELAWGADGTGALLVEAARAIAPGRAFLDVAFDGAWAADSGVARDSAGATARLERGAVRAFPGWPGPVVTPWTLLVHAPERYEVRASGRRTGIDEAPGWRTWNFRVSRALPGDSLRVALRPAPGRPRRPRRRGRAARTVRAGGAPPARRGRRGR